MWNMRRRHSSHNCLPPAARTAVKGARSLRVAPANEAPGRPPQRRVRDVSGRFGTDVSGRFAASKLAESTSLFDPGVREFGDLRSLAVDCFCLFGLHFGFESRGHRRILAASDGPSPFGALLLGAALITQRTATTCCFRCSVDLQAHTMLAVLHNMKSKSFASGTNVDVVLSVVRKLATNKLSPATVGVILGRFPAIMPGTIEIDLRGFSGVH